jgi:two-component system cell cycle sensor histidine kinase/response regulator CckA
MTSINTEKSTVTVLIVDDESNILDTLREQLAYFGYNIITACSGKEALQKAEEFKRIDILLTDIMMPYMNGIELAKKFNKLLPETKIFFMSGYTFPSLNVHELPKENYSFFEKPFSIDKLNSEFSKVLTN